MQRYHCYPNLNGKRLLLIAVLTYQDGIAVTDTKIKLMFNWTRLTLRQQGADRRRDDQKISEKSIIRPNNE
ncbi:protein of unknown function [Moritella yayanosii]|uniref:Uncharacterized protein n=1 Tax=Moritella yayanosii TaxID=69539 RepID=A0A330LPS5_9GAMM|nr:protein of unknown function [Moritella yayanosii]